MCVYYELTSPVTHTHDISGMVLVSGKNFDFQKYNLDNQIKFWILSCLRVRY